MIAALPAARPPDPASHELQTARCNPGESLRRLLHPGHTGRLLLGCSLILLLAGCETMRGFGDGDVINPIRVSQVIGDGDPARRASTRLVVQGLEADAAGEPRRARGSYERSIQVDPTNPYSYLALARHHLDGSHPGPALQLLDQAAALFESQGMKGPRVGVHLIGLRGRAFHATGRGEDGVLYLERARQLAPEVWSDGYLAAEELL